MVTSLYICIQWGTSKNSTSTCRILYVGNIEEFCLVAIVFDVKMLVDISFY